MSSRGASTQASMFVLQKAEKEREERRRMEETEARAKHLLEQENMRKKLANAAAEEGKRRSQIYLQSSALQY